MRTLDFLPGRFILEAGSVRDYDRLAPFHYCARRPATFAAIRVVRYLPAGHGLAEKPARLAAVGVLSYPTPSCGARERALGTAGLDARTRLLHANRLVRTISRVIVHPQFRSLGLAGQIIGSLCQACPTRYIECVARMGALHPMFLNAGLRNVDPADPTYFLGDPRHAHVFNPGAHHVSNHPARSSPVAETEARNRRSDPGGVPGPSGAF